ncbi:aldehyde dehydrogenase [Pseudomonas gingeri NCPPB 3146 = LMG 5327]|uniref:Aldehyde dehydrogenase n=3 Tax=Pseudomonas gingeri TaxID=117681 RepID=A0A7Y7Y4R0_9PSED|nr:aldehyde dehydrogenase family protein [Pseudomonas sp. Ost2]NWC17765.1 aldehyde dehydrogenase [Pseudomonas gingeri]NWE48344.1 aldehyde dehydrogenase [Pseudomonas gingeri]NWE69099.1 aldehyde dehydrogenase [Pseudomonas gingeri]PNQ92594.1 aldehyde dehydrogenase [Pseudomonas gingeri NCPPB 3146 = LMG 5327]
MTATAQLMRERSAQHFINGDYQAGRGCVSTIINPATEQPVGDYAEATAEEMEQAIALANQVQKVWWALSALERAEALHQVADNLYTLSATVGECLTREMGKPYREAEWEVRACASALRYYAELARQEQGRVAGPAIAGQLHMSLKEPLGTVVSIVPYNFPVLLMGWQAAAALAAGNAIIVKPSEQTSLTQLLLMPAFAPLPRGLIQVLTGGAEVGRHLVAHPHTHGIAFTGSVSAGQAVAQSAALRFKPTLIEASGNDPFIVMPSACVETVARAAAYAAFLNCGQVCTSAERFYVHEQVYESFVQALSAEARKLRIGNGLEHVDIGPLASERELNRVERLVAQALEQGARLVCGGKRPGHLHRGWFFEPTVLEVRHDMDIMHGECFGPIAPICKVRSLDEAIVLANDSEMGLGASIYTENLAEAMRAINEIESGIVWVNTPLNDNDCVPFGGRKMTGTGRELGVEGLEQFRRSKMVMIAPRAVDDPEWFPYPQADAFPVTTTRVSASAILGAGELGQ